MGLRARILKGELSYETTKAKKKQILHPQVPPNAVTKGNSICKGNARTFRIVKVPNRRAKKHPSLISDSDPYSQKT